MRLRVPTSRMRFFSQGIARSAAAAVRFASEETRASTSSARAHLRAILAGDPAPSTNSESDLLKVRKRLAAGKKGGLFARPRIRERKCFCTHAEREDRINMEVKETRKSSIMSHRLGGPRLAI